jgi:hypothetical protein
VVLRVHYDLGKDHPHIKALCSQAAVDAVLMLMLPCIWRVEEAVLTCVLECTPGAASCVCYGRFCKWPSQFAEDAEQADAEDMQGVE